MRLSIHKTRRTNNGEETVVYWLDDTKQDTGICIFEIPVSIYESSAYLKENLDFMITNAVTRSCETIIKYMTEKVGTVWTAIDPDK